MMQLGVITTDGHFLEFIYPCWQECDCFFVSHDFQKRVANKEEEKQRIQDDTKELREEQQHRWRDEEPRSEKCGEVGLSIFYLLFMGFVAYMEIDTKGTHLWAKYSPNVKWMSV